MSTSQYLFGAAELAVIVAALGIGAFHVRALLVPAWTGALARLAEFILGISALVVIAELLGVLKLLEEVPLVAVCALVGIGAAWWARPRLPPGPPHQFPAVRSSTLMVIVSVIAAAIVVAHWSEASQESLDTGMYYQDTTWYHMSFSGRFAQSGEVGPLHFTDPLKLTAWYYPQNSELLHAVGMVTLDTDLLSPLINLGWLAVSLLAAWCIGRPFAVSAVTVLGAAVILDSEMMVASQAGNAPNDVAGVFFLLAVIAFIVNGAATARAAPDLASAGHPTGEAPLPSDEPGFDPEATDEHPQTGVVEDVPVAGDPRVLAGIGTGPLFLAGLAAGLGIGTKITLLAALGALTIGIAYLGGRRHWWQAMAWWLGGTLITAGFWYGRNLFYSLNPFPQIDKLGPLNLPGPDQGGFYPREAHSLSEYYNDPHIWKDWFFPVLENRLGPLWPVILAAAAFGLLFVLVKGGSRLMRVLAITGIVAGLAYVFTPLTASGGLGQPTGFDANLRYVAPALIMAFVLLPLVPSVRHRPWPWVLIGGFAVLIFQGAFIADDVTGLTIPRSWDFGHHDESLILALLVVGVPAAIVAAGRAGVNRWALAGLGLFALVATVVLGETQREEYLDNRYEVAVAPPLETGFRSTPEWKPIQEFGKDTRGARIAVVGRASAFGQYFFYGDDLSNYVQYLGEELRRGTFRQIANCKKLRRVINAGDFDYVVVTPRIRRETSIPPELAWVGEDDATTKVVRSGGLAAVFEVDGELDPSTCGEAERIYRKAKARESAIKAAEAEALEEEEAAAEAEEDS
ncbi:MAG: hypothetical protein ACXWZW_07195 [Solirubrobacterales bacterium]